MIDAQSTYFAFGRQLQDQLVRRLEHFLSLHRQRRQVVYVEEAAIVDLIGRVRPIRQAIALVRQQVVEQIKRLWITWAAVEDLDVLLDEVMYDGATRAQSRELALDPLFIVETFLDLFR